SGRAEVTKVYRGHGGNFVASGFLQRIPMRNTALALLTVLVALGVGSVALERRAAALADAAPVAPRFDVDPLWPKPLPNHWIGGNGRGTAPGGRGTGAARGQRGGTATGAVLDESQTAGVQGYFNDSMVLKFTASGKFLLQIGKPGQSKGSNDTDNLRLPAKT